MGPRVLIVDDHTVLSQALADALSLHGISEVVAAVLHAEAGQPVLPESERRVLLSELADSRKVDEARRGPFKRLTPREQEVLAGLVGGRAVSRQT